MQISEKLLTPETKKKEAPILPMASFVDADQIPKPVGHKSETADPETYYDKFFRSIMDQAKDYPLPVPVVNIIQDGEEIPLLTLKSYSLWQGKQKSKKTTVLAIMIAAFISHELNTDSIRFDKGLKGKVLFFDNEQGESYAARTMKLILKLAGQEINHNLKYCDLREFTPLDRAKIIEAGIEFTPNVKLVIIDGIVDLMTDFMDASEGHLTITNLIKLCSLYDIHVAGVLHQNKNDKNARAHVGTISSQKCEIEISTEVDPEDISQSIVTCANSRGLPFKPFAIRWDKGSWPCINQEWSTDKNKDAKDAKNFEKNKEIAEAVFKPFTALSHTEAINSIMNISLKSESTAKRLIKEYLAWGLITKGPDGNYRISSTQGSGFTQGSNGVHEPVQ